MLLERLDGTRTKSGQPERVITEGSIYCRLPDATSFYFSEINLTPTPNQLHYPPILSRHEGRYASSRNVGRDAMDASVRKTSVLDAYCEIVWS